MTHRVTQEYVASNEGNSSGYRRAYRHHDDVTNPLTTLHVGNGIKGPPVEDDNQRYSSFVTFDLNIPRTATNVEAKVTLYSAYNRAGGQPIAFAMLAHNADSHWAKPARSLSLHTRQKALRSAAFSNTVPWSTITAIGTIDNTTFGEEITRTCIGTTVWCINGPHTAPLDVVWLQLFRTSTMGPVTAVRPGHLLWLELYAVDVQDYFGVPVGESLSTSIPIAYDDLPFITYPAAGQPIPGFTSFYFNNDWIPDHNIWYYLKLCGLEAISSDPYVGATMNRSDVYDASPGLWGSAPSYESVGEGQALSGKLYSYGSDLPYITGQLYTEAIPARIYDSSKYTMSAKAWVQNQASIFGDSSFSPDYSLPLGSHIENWLHDSVLYDPAAGLQRIAFTIDDNGIAAFDFGGYWAAVILAPRLTVSFDLPDNYEHAGVRVREASDGDSSTLRVVSDASSSGVREVSSIAAVSVRPTLHPGKASVRPQRVEASSGVRTVYDVLSARGYRRSAEAADSGVRPVKEAANANSRTVYDVTSSGVRRVTTISGVSVRSISNVS